MKIKLSEIITRKTPPDDTTQQLDELALRRIRTLALEKAGFAQPAPQKRRLGKRSMIVLVAALVFVLLLTTALATSDIGALLAGMYKGDDRLGEMFKVLGQFGHAVDSEVSDQGITVRAEAAYANEVESMVVLSFEDTLSRLTKEMDLSIDFTPSSSFSRWAPTMTPDGKLCMLLVADGGTEFEGKIVEITINSIVPDIRYRENESTGITIRDALSMKLPYQVPDLPQLSFTDIHMEADGLVIAGQYLENYQQTGFRAGYFALKRPNGQIIESDHRGEMYGMSSDNKDEPMNLVECGFDRPGDIEALLDSELVVSYYERQSEPIEGEWKLRFRMPRSQGPLATAQIDKIFNIGGWDYRIETAKLYQSCVWVDYSTVLPFDQLERVEREYPEGKSWLFDDSVYPNPEFRLVDAEGKEIEGAGYFMHAVGDMDSNKPQRYEAVMHCLAEQQSSIVLEVLDGITKQMLLRQPLK